MLEINKILSLNGRAKIKYTKNNMLNDRKPAIWSLTELSTKTKMADSINYRII